jgi:predicted O-linked N-acetylglucosamine transferase (SPINDLY family)
MKTNRLTNLQGNQGNIPELLRLGYVCMQQGNFSSAERNFQKVLESNPDQVDALNLLGIVNAQSKRLEIAINYISRAISLNSRNASSYYNRGLALQELGRVEEALLDFKVALSLNPKHTNAFNSEGNAYLDMKEIGPAITSYKNAIALDPSFADAWNNLGNAYSYGKNLEEALNCYEKAVSIYPDFADAWVNSASAWYELKEIEKAVHNYQKALEMKADIPYLLGDYLHAKLQGCDWSNLTQATLQLQEQISRQLPVTEPFVTLGLLDDPALHQQVAQIYIHSRFPKSTILGPLDCHEKSDKIRIGYYSADFRNHATSYLVAEMLEKHDKDKFEVYTFNLHPGKPDDTTARIVSAVTQMIDLSGRSDKSAAQLSRELKIDIAVDLGGHTADSRTGIFAARCAPVQVSYLGFPGTMGAPYYDYVLADCNVVPLDQSVYYTEKLAHLPHSYQVNDSKRKISDRVFVRSECGLPAQAFVFCCFNNGYKILPPTFDGWMRILHAVEGSVLWLMDHNELGTRNLKREAQARGIDPSRLIFAPRMKLPEHLARHRLADLFLDTLPYNAHTTASDALWAGLPLLTCMGKSFAARVAGSLLMAMDLPELITHTQTDFEAKAIEYATDPMALSSVKSKLLRNLTNSPLFNAELFTLHLEQAYRIMHSRQQAGLPAEHFTVEA